MCKWLRAQACEGTATGLRSQGRRLIAAIFRRVACAVDVDFRIHLIEYCRDAWCCDIEPSLYSCLESLNTVLILGFLHYVLNDGHWDNSGYALTWSSANCSVPIGGRFAKIWADGG